MQKQMGKKASQQGFTLVELSIVLVIIGLIVGGVLVGQSLIQAAKVRAQLTQLDQFDAALNAFRARFDCLPGDCTAASGITNAAGNGDGVINYSATWTATLESALAWQQMGAQGMIAGTYVPNATYSSAQVPNARVGGQVMIGSAGAYNYYALGNFTTDTGALLIPADVAFAIDTKRDDGNPITGFTQAVQADAVNGPFAAAVSAAGTGAAADCLTAGSAYNTTVTTSTCLVRVRTSG